MWRWALKRPPEPGLDTGPFRVDPGRYAAFVHAVDIGSVADADLNACKAAVTIERFGPKSGWIVDRVIDVSLKPTGTYFDLGFT